jgi:hypothetical protein
MFFKETKRKDFECFHHLKRQMLEETDMLENYTMFTCTETHMVYINMYNLYVSVKRKIKKVRIIKLLTNIFG